MTFKSIQLLKRLEPPIRPAYAGVAALMPKTPLESQSFSELLGLVSDGSVRSDRPVTIDLQDGEELDDEQLERLAAAADLAESSGAERALMLIDGRGLVLEVGLRRVTSELSPNEPDPVIGLDAAVYVVSDHDQSNFKDSGSAIRFPGSGLIPPSVAAQIQRARDAGAEPRSNETRETQSPGHRHTG